jgi:hypothetical protein
MSARRRRRPRTAALRPFWFVSIAALAVAAVAGYLLVSWPGFAPKRVRVVGNSIVPASEILERARINPRRNIWLQNAGAMARRIDAIPYVLFAHVHREPPATVTIVVTERRPFAQVRSGDESALVDSAMRVLESGTGSESLPIIVLEPAVALVPGRFLSEPSASAMRSALLALHAHDVSVDQLDDNNGDVTAILPGNVRVLLGDEANAAKAIPLIEPILTRFALLGRFVAILDLRSPTTPVATERTLRTRRSTARTRRSMARARKARRLASPQPTP